VLGPSSHGWAMDGVGVLVGGLQAIATGWGFMGVVAASLPWLLAESCLICWAWQAHAWTALEQWMLLVPRGFSFGAGMPQLWTGNPTLLDAVQRQSHPKTHDLGTSMVDGGG